MKATAKLTVPLHVCAISSCVLQRHIITRSATTIIITLPIKEQSVAQDKPSLLVALDVVHPFVQPAMKLLRAYPSLRP